MPDVTVWLSPQDPIATYAEALDLLRQMQRVVPGRVRIAIPTAYGAYLQGQMERPQYRALGDELSPATLDDLQALRARFEADGVPCDGWDVPRGNTPDGAYAEGVRHGEVAKLFDRFLWNTEWGWPSYWTHPGDVATINAFIGGFWTTVGDHPLQVGWTLVPNTMLDASTDAELRAWSDGSHFTVLEVYTPNDRNLDPYNGLARWRARATSLGITQPAVVMVEQGDLLAYDRQLADAVHGTHIWTLNSTRDYWAAQPTPDGPVTPGYTPLEAKLINQLGYLHGDLVRDFRAELARKTATNRPAAPRKATLTALVNTLEAASA